MEFKAFVKFTNYIPCDALVAALFIHPSFAVESSDWHCVVELNGRDTRGQLVLDHLRDNANNATIVERVCPEDLKTILMWVVGVEGEVEII